MTGFGFGSLYGADPGLPYTDPLSDNALGMPGQPAMSGAMNNTAALLAQYTPQQLAVAKARGMIGQNGVPLVPPSAFKVNSQGQPYSPDIQPQKVSSPFDPNDPYVNGGEGNLDTNPAEAAASNTGNPIADYIVQGAKARGIDPNEALHTVMTEGGLGAFKIGDKQWKGSGGPFQLNMLPGSLGDQMLKQTGLNPLDPANEKAGIDYALNYVQNHGGHFSPDIWHGLRNNPFKGGTVNIPQYASAGGSDSQGSTGTMDASSSPDTAVDNTGLPGLGSLRQIAANAMIDPSKLQNPATGMMLQKLMQNPQVSSMMTGGGNTSAMLARMAGGFFGGRGPAQSLAGGFNGMADQMSKDQATRATLLGSLLNNQNDLYKMGIENNMGVNKSLLTAAALMPSRGMQLAGMLSRSGLPPGTAMTVAGVLPKGDPRAAEADAAYKTENPLPASAQAQQTKLLDNVNTQRVFENQISPYIDAVKSGQLPLTGAKIAEYNTRNSTWGRYIGMPPTPQSTMYNQLKAILSQRQLDVASGLKGATTDKDLEVSMNTLMGNGAQNNAESLLPHLTGLKARAALDEQNGIKRVNQFRIDQRKQPLDIDSNVSAPASDFSNLPGSQLSKLLVANGQPLAAPGATPPAIGGTTPPVGAAPPVGGGAGGVGQIKLPSGSTLSY